MYKAAIEHARNAIANATLHTDPFDHIYVENVFPEDFYATLQANLPDTQFYDRLADTPRVSPNYNRERYVISSTLSSLNKLPGAQRDFWLEFLRAMYVQSFAHSVLTKFGPTIQTRFAKEAGHEGMDLNLQWNALLIRDLAQYS
ncbi:MAG: hypothetical protein HOI95_06170, partial [Chromatiales bacterium]|nr:hypothetical protein [Chromatiales bacterium]